VTVIQEEPVIQEEQAVLPPLLRKQRSIRKLIPIAPSSLVVVEQTSVATSTLLKINSCGAPTKKPKPRKTLKKQCQDADRHNGIAEPNSKRRCLNNLENIYKKTYNNKSNFLCDEVILEFINGVCLNVYSNLNISSLIDEDSIIVNNFVSKRILLIYDNLKKKRFDFSKYFSSDAILSIESLVTYSMNQTWACSVYSKDVTKSSSIGCDKCNEWFHFSCVKLKKNFIGNYFCSSCI
jgi:hypothetical protein